MLATTNRYSPEAVKGLVIACVSSFVFLYLTAWLLFLPFVDDDHHARKFFFPLGGGRENDRQLVINALTQMGGVMISLCGATIGLALLRKKER
jgi:hypothetical protein